MTKNENCTWPNFHDTKTCRCIRGDIGRKKTRDANEKRRVLCKTAKGLAVQKGHREKAAKKRQIINQCKS